MVDTRRLPVMRQLHTVDDIRPAMVVLCRTPTMGSCSARTEKIVVDHVDRRLREPWVVDARGRNWCFTFNTDVDTGPDRTWWLVSDNPGIDREAERLGNT